MQPPIQGKYRDNYIFLDSLTKMPTIKKIIKDDKTGSSLYSDKDLLQLYCYLRSKFEND